MSRPVFDSNIFIAYDVPDRDLDKMRLSSIVLYELTATTIDEQTREFYERLKIAAEYENDLITPDDEDFWETAKIVSRWRHKQKRGNKNKTPPLACPCEPQNDALIGYTAWKNNCFVVTDNLDDFNRFKDFWKVKVKSAKEYFG